MKGGWPNCALTVVLSICVWACGGTQSTTEVDPLERALQRADQLVGEAVVQGLDAEEDQDRIVFTARYNPAADCGCPAWEIVYRGRWMRVHLDASADEQMALEAQTEQAERDHEADVFATYRLVGRIDRELVLVEQTGMRYRTLWLVQVDDEGGDGM
jgi:hypothetical protein